ncbi:Uncharacterised protein [Acetobacterium wieringae]|jgi:hypothetical protein|nr:Uncharacterised protein [Acetobacterium wieringae]
MEELRRLSELNKHTLFQKTINTNNSGVYGFLLIQFI